MTDDGLIAFITWCRTNSQQIVFNVEIARRVYIAYELGLADQPEDAHLDDVGD